MNSIKYAAVCISAVVMIIFVKEYDGRFAVLMRIAFSVSCAIVSLALFGKIYGYVREVAFSDLGVIALLPST